MEISLTIKAHIKVASSDNAKSLADSMEIYRQGCNFVSQYVFEHDFELRQAKLNKALYSDLRQKFSLRSQMAQSVLKTVIARYKSVQTQLGQKPYKIHDINAPQGEGCYAVQRDLDWLWKPIFFKRPQLDEVRGRDYSFKQNGKIVSVNTLDGRIECEIAMPGFEQYLNDEWTFGTARILKSGKHWFMHISATKSFPDYEIGQTRHVVGIDRGLRQIAACYDEKGKTLFRSGKAIARKRQHYKELRSHLQAKNTRSSKRRIRKIGNRENRWMSDCNHCLSKTLVSHYGPDTLFVLEDLTDVTFDTVYNRKRENRYEHHSWSFYDLEQKLKYKAHLNGSEVVKVDAHYTSQRCPKCGRIFKENRDHGLHMYICDRCGYRSNDDRIAAMNIQMLGTMYVSGVPNPSYQSKRGTSEAKKAKVKKSKKQTN